MGLSETYPDVLSEAPSNLSSFIHYDCGVQCAPKSIRKISLQIEFPNEFLEYNCCSRVVFQGLYHGIPWALHCNNYSNCENETATSF